MKRGKYSKQKSRFFELEKPTTNNPSEQKLEQENDFEHTVARGKKIKERIRKMYEDRFTAEQIREDHAFAREIIQAAASLNKNVDLYGSEELNPKASFELDPQDSYHSKKPEVLVFPIAEQKLFPPRRPQTGWEVGLRKYEDIQQKKAVRAAAEAAAASSTQVEAAAVDNYGQNTKKLSIMNISLTELKKAQYATRKLPELTTEVVDRYFDENSVAKFNQTYRQLKQQGTIIYGGYEALHEVVKDKDVNLLTVAMTALKNEGIFTPRDEKANVNIAGKRNKFLDQRRPKSSSSAMKKTSLSTSGLLSTSTNSLPRTTETETETETETAFLPRFSLNDASNTVSQTNVSANIVDDIELSLSPTITSPILSPNIGASSMKKKLSVGWVKAGELENDDVSVSNSIVSHGSRPSLKSAVEKGVASMRKTESLKLPAFNALSSSSSVHSFHLSSSLFDEKPFPIEENISIEAPREEREESKELLDLLKLNRLQDHSYDDKGAELEYTPGSPRAVFLAGCLKEGLPPRAHVLLRKRISSSINLAHIGIGNEMAKVLAEALSSLPYLQAINLSDNNLEDDGISAIIKAIAAHPTIEIVDISQNTIDSEAAHALADFVGNPDCKLQCLRMSDANIDDGECASFVEVLMNNRHLKELDMSKNLLGKDENLNTVQPDFTTGAEALSELLKEGLCPIQTLNLHWNMIRLEGAEVLCDAIRTNIHLTNLDLSYNALGSSAACILGASLMENKTLRVLNIANNGIDTIGCFTLFVGLRENSSLREINIDGNPIGEQGARILMKTVAYEGHRLKISSKNCDFNIKSSLSKFQLQSPFGEYLLDLSQPYDRAILVELLDIAANDPAVQINSLEYSEKAVARSHLRPGSAHGSNPADSRPASASKGPPSNSNSRPTSANPNAKGGNAKGAAVSSSSSFQHDKPRIGGTIHKIIRYDEENDHLSEEELKESEFLKSFQRAIEMTPTDFFNMAKNYDTQGKSTVSTVGMKKILSELQLQQIPRLMSEIKFTIDPSGSGYYGIDEFVEYIVERSKVVNTRIKHMTLTPRCALYRPTIVGTKGSMILPSSIPIGQLFKYVPPTIGSVYVKVIESYDVSSDEKEVTSPLTDSQCKQIIKTAKESSNPLQLMLFGIEAFQLHLEEAQLLIKEIGSRSDDPTLALSKILLRMKSSYSAMRLMHCYTHNDIVKIRRLKQRLGNAYNPLVGLYSGYYALDLSNENDRLCLKKLIEKSVKNVDHRRRNGLWDTSQHGHWSCFRNEMHFSNYGSSEPKESIFISPKYFFPVPHKGKLEFDFINIERPNPAINRPADHDRIIDCLLVSCLLEEEYVKDVVCKINDLKMVSRRQLMPDGAPYWRTSHARALFIGDHLYTMYSTLKQRGESRKKALKRELIKSVAIEKPREKRRNDGKGKASGFYSSSASVKKTTKINFEHNEVHHLSMVMPSVAIPEAGTGKSESPTTVEPTIEEVTADSKVLARIKKIANAFRSLVFKSRAESTGKSWGKRLHEVVDSNGSDEYKCAAILEYFETELTSLWLYCVHVSIILELFYPLGIANRSSVGSYRVELVIMLFDRILDLYNFELVLMVLNAEEQAALYARIGILNIFNPCKPEGGYSIDLHRWEERQTTKALIHLSVVEPGENWLNKEFTFDRGFLPMPGWDLNITWLNEEGLPKKGLLSFEMFAGDGIRQLGCCVDVKLRLMLTSLVLVNQRDFAAEIERGDLLSEERTFNYERGDRNPVNIVPHMATKTQFTPGHGQEPTSGKKGRKSGHTIRTILPIERDGGHDSTPHEHYETNETAHSHVGGDFNIANPDYKALLPRLKLLTQADILAMLNTPFDHSPDLSTSGIEFHAFSYEDCNRHLSTETDVLWSYTSSNQKYESWFMK